MAEPRRYGLVPQLDIEQILLDAQHRWLRPAEICEILRNYKQFCIAPEPPIRPPSGSLFLFDRKVLRYFRKDGHNWRKKKDGKTVKEAHERLKSGSIDVLHCYYAHGEENENFQRRSYWMLEEDLMHIVLVHYREVKNNKPSYSRSRDVEDVQQVSRMDSPIGSSSTSITNQSQLPSQTTDADSPNSTHTSEYEDAESDNYQRSSRYHPHVEMQQYDNGSVIGAQFLDPFVPPPTLDSQSNFQETKAAEVRSDFSSIGQEDEVRLFDESGLDLTFSGSKTQYNLTSLDEVLEHCTPGFQAPFFQPSVSFSPSITEDANSRLQPLLYEDIYTVGSSGAHADVTDAQVISAFKSSGHIENDTFIEDNRSQTSLVKQSSLDFSSIEGEGLKKYDSFSRWMSKELGEVDDPHLQSSSIAYWNDIESENVEDSTASNHENLNSYIMSPSLSQEQLFSIIDFSPTWAYSFSGTKVLVTGIFLKNNDKKHFNWSCMFGEIEVPAEVMADGVLRCHAPPHKSGRVPFYVTCSNRLSCSEVREFEFRESDEKFMDTSDFCYSSMNEMLFQLRLDKLLSLEPNDYTNQDTNILKEKAPLITKISSVMVEVNDEWSDLIKATQDDDFSPENTKDQLLEALFREKLHSWLLHKVTEDGKGPSILDDEGQGVLHLVAALGYDWAIKPIVTAGVNINFRDAHGWTALHWAASCGRERTVGILITMGAAPGAVTDPTPEHPSGRTPADLASANNHKGIGGFLAESSLTTHLSALTIKDSKGNSALGSLTGIGNILDHAAIQEADSDTQGDLSLKDSLTAVRNASQAAARIYQVFRVQSFHRKKQNEYGNDEYGVSDERTLSFVSVKSAKSGPHDMPFHAAAIRIQNKFRGWKGRKEFLIIRQRIVKIQAHVRGHQVRKHLRKVVWSIGIMEKAILRWRRKRSGLRGFRAEKLLEGPSLQQQPSKEDDYDFLREGRKRSEASLQKALARVKSMVQYPEARDQYRRLLTVVTELQESKAMQENLMNEDEDAVDGESMIELEEHYEDSTTLMRSS